MLKLAQDTGFLASGRHLFAINQGSVFEDLRVPAENLLGQEGQGFAYARYVHSRFPGYGAAWAAWVAAPSNRAASNGRKR